MQAIAMEAFGEALICRVRDQAIDDFERIAGRMYHDDHAKHLCELIHKSGAVADIVQQILPEFANTLLFHLLVLIESDKRLTVTWNGTSVVDAVDSLAGALWTSEGWIARYSKKACGQVE